MFFFREHDKDPETFFSVMYRLKNEKEEFLLSVIGETFSEKPGKFLKNSKCIQHRSCFIYVIYSKI